MKNKLRNYDIQAKLGSGSYGVIYKAINRNDKSTCVLKQIKLTKLNQKAKKNAINEATILGKLSHPFIVQYIDSFIQDGSLNIIMEYCNGGDLAQFLKLQSKKPLKQQKIWKLFLQICIGLQHIHQRKILHRDIKSLNIFLHEDQVKIGDLGVAKMLEQRDFAQTMVGTPFYLSPQLCQQKPYNQKSDIWALGCLLYELCTFKHPFQAANQASLILKIVRGKYNPIPQFYSKDLKDLIDSCLERDYKRRPTCQMILTKTKIKQYIQTLHLNDIKPIQKPINIVKLDEKQNSKQKPNKNDKKQQNVKNPAQQKNFLDKSNQLPSNQLIKPNQNKNYVNNGFPAAPKNQLKKQQIKKPEVPLPKKIQVIKQIIKKPQIPLSKRPDSAKRQLVVQTPVIRQINVRQNTPMLLQKQLPPSIKKQDKIDKKSQPKIQSKQQFLKNLQKILQQQKPIINKKPSLYWQIQAKNNQQIKKNKNQEILKNELIQKQKEIITRVKMQKVVQPKVYQSNKNIGKSRGIIKSGGFLPEEKQQKVQKQRNKVKKVQQSKRIFGRKPSFAQRINNDKSPQDLEKDVQSSRYRNNEQQFKSQKNLKSNEISGSTPINFKEKIVIQPQKHLSKKNNFNNLNIHLPPRVRKGSNNHQMARNAQQASQKNNLTKQQRQQVINLPNMIKNGIDSSDQQTQKSNTKVKVEKITVNSKFNFKLKDVDEQQILEKYEQILKSKKEINQSSSSRLQTNQVSQQKQDNNLEQNNHQNEQDIIYDQSQNFEEGANKLKQQFQNVQNQHQFQQQQTPQEQINQNYSGSQQNYSNVYQINKFNLDQIEDSLQNAQTIKYNQNQKQRQNDKQSQWQFDAQPELPMIQETQTPYFEQANPYLIDQKAQQQTLEDKKNYLQIKLQQNLKRQDQINRLMQIKIDQCKAIVTTGFQEILDFFRQKLNTDQYTQQDEQQIDAFLKKKGLTDHRKFQNIYKIMHFEMQLQNTRKIIQKLCQKLSQLQC